MGWILFDYNGILAITLGAIPDWNEPKMVKLIKVSDIYTQGWEQLLGKELEHTDGNRSVILHEGNWIDIDTSNWTDATEITPIKPPRKRRDGKGYNWHNGRWRLDW